MSRLHLPSSVRVFGKSVHMIAWGWFASVWWLWLAGVRQHLRRQGTMPPDYGVSVLLGGAAVGVVIWAIAKWLTRATGPAPHPDLEWREWHHAFWWAAVPNAMLLGTVYLMILATA